MSDRLAQALRLYRRRVSRCPSENMVNRVHIAVENYITPAEVRYFGTALAEDAADSPSRRWIENLGRLLPVNGTRPVEFERKGIVKGATLYTAGGETTDRKTLVIGFAGHFHRLMAPMPCFLDCLNPALYDVVVLRDFSRIYYALGIPGLGDDFFTTLASLRSRVDPRGYRHAIALGTSGGGLPALLAAILLELDKGIAICPQDLAQVTATLTAHGLRSDPLAALLASRPDRFPELVLSYPADSPADAAAAAAIHARVRSELQPVKKCAEHTLLGWHLQRGTLPAYLSRLLGLSLESCDLGAASLVATFAMGPDQGSPWHSLRTAHQGTSTFDS